MCSARLAYRWVVSSIRLIESVSTEVHLFANDVSAQTIKQSLRSGHVWLVGSRQNQTLFSDIENTSSNELSIFSSDGSLAESLPEYLATIMDRHGEYSPGGPITFLTVYGLPSTARLEQAFEEFGFGSEEKIAESVYRFRWQPS